jgi:protein-tyrosine phosphatase
MIDIHCHLLPGIDDGARDLETALEMARIAHGDGITDIVCTPHIYPGMYENDADGIRAAVADLQVHLDNAGLKLRLHAGADAHLTPDLGQGIAAGRIPTLAGSRYLLLEPPHHVAPPRFEETVFELMAAGVVPVITHPERLSWVETHHGIFERLAARGCWMQITAGALTGRFGPRPRYWGDRFVCEGRAHVLATDAHHPARRPPLLHEAYLAAERLVGSEQALHLVSTRPALILADHAPDQAPPPLAVVQESVKGPFRWLAKWLP